MGLLQRSRHFDLHGLTSYVLFHLISVFLWMQNVCVCVCVHTCMYIKQFIILETCPIPSSLSLDIFNHVPQILHPDFNIIWFSKGHYSSPLSWLCFHPLHSLYVQRFINLSRVPYCSNRKLRFIAWQVWIRFRILEYWKWRLSYKLWNTDSPQVLK